MTTGDTIAAISSAVGSAARIIVRLSGSRAFEIAQHLCANISPAPNKTLQTRMAVGDLIFPACVYSFLNPRSYTGEDLIEFHIPGNPTLAKLVLEEIFRLGARPAEAGEFTARAYFNGRIDLTEAEGVAATIAAHSEQEMLAARQLLAGELARRLRPIMDLIAETLALVEVGIDFSEEDVTFLSVEQITRRVTDAEAMLLRLVAESSHFEQLTHEPRIVLVGRPNAGKSTLLNTLAGEKRAVVSPVAGTTRDAIWAEVTLARGIVRVVDVAGVGDEDLPEAADEIERQMRHRALRAVAKADVLVLVQEAQDARPRLKVNRSIDLTVISKADHATDEITDQDGEIRVSAHSGANVQRLRNRLDELAFGRPGQGSALALNTRHLQEIHQAGEALARLKSETSRMGPELMAVELRDALDALGRVLGSVSPDDLLGRIFSAFCVGK